MKRRLAAASLVLALFSSGCAGRDSSSSPAGAIPCNDAQFATEQSEFAAGSLSGDQPVQICGTVSRVRRARRTRSGEHGYFYVTLPAGSRIEIVSNLDAMARASSDDPPAWPWVAAGDYVYVQGRYYYDDAAHQGIDWTEDDTSAAWPHPGYVIVCDAAKANCSKYW